MAAASSTAPASICDVQQSVALPGLDLNGIRPTFPPGGWHHRSPNVLDVPPVCAAAVEIARKGRVGLLIEEGEHAASVDAWLQRTGAGLSSAALLQLFEAALGALWARTVTILGEVTLTAIADRVLHNAAQKLPLFSSLRVEPNGGGIQFDELRESGSAMSTTDVLEGIRFVLVEFLTVIGNLTAGILTAELHAEFSEVEPTNAVRGDKGARSHPVNRVNSRGRG